MDILTQKQTTKLPTKLGEITVQIPSLRMKLDIERRRSYYTGGLVIISSDGADLADMFATLDVVMIESPLSRVDNDKSSWDYNQVYDDAALKDAYDKAVEWLDSFRKPVAGEQA